MKNISYTSSKCSMSGAVVVLLYLEREINLRLYAIVIKLRNFDTANTVLQYIAKDTQVTKRTWTC